MLIRWRFICLYFFLASMILSLVLVPLFRRLALRFRVVDHPSGRKLHDTPMPLLGGAAMFCAFFGMVLIHYLAQPVLIRSDLVKEWVPDYYLSYLAGVWYFGQKIVVVFFGALAVSAVGLLDDMYDLPIRLRFYLEVVIATVVVSVGIQPYVPALPQAVVWTLSIVWLVGITNSFNLLDGADGLAAGVGVLSSLLLAVVMAWGGQPFNAVWLCVLAGAAAGFLIFNFPPARIFMGSLGSMFLGYILAVSVLMSTSIPREGNLLFFMLVPLLILGIPLYDTFSVIAIRLFQGRPIALADQSHFVHRLMHLGFSVRQAVLFIYLLTLCFGITAVLMVRADTLTSVVLFLQILMLFGAIVLLERVMFTTERIRGKQIRRGGQEGAPSGVVQPKET